MEKEKVLSSRFSNKGDQEIKIKYIKNYRIGRNGWSNGFLLVKVKGLKKAENIRHNFLHFMEIEERLLP